MAKCGFALKTDDMLHTVQQIVKEDNRPNPFKDSRPGRRWYLGFMKRNPELALLTSEGITKGRAVVTEEYVRKWFSELYEYLKQQNVKDILSDPNRIFNGDETSFSMCPKTGKVIAPKGYKNIYNLLDLQDFACSNSDNITMNPENFISNEELSKTPELLPPKSPQIITCSLPTSLLSDVSKTCQTIPTTSKNAKFQSMPISPAFEKHLFHPVPINTSCDK